jgi:SAM-dependent methyltransferase
MTFRPADGCRLCGAADVEKLHARRFQPVEGVSFMDGYDVCVCRACGFGFAGGLPEQAAFNRYYKECSKYDNAVAYRRNYAEHDAFYVNAVRRYAPGLEAAILEIGCAMGDLLSALRDGGFSNLAGADPSPACAAQVASRGIPCVCASIDDLDAPGRYDAILLGGVLEHCRDLTGSLRKLASMLKSGGHLFFNVPDVMKFSVAAQPPFQEFSLEHINYFSERSLANLAAVHGLEQAAARPCPAGGLLSVMRKAAGGDVVFDPGTKQALIRYIQDSTALDARVERILAPFHGRPLIVWGVGTYTRHLLAAGTLARCDIRAFVDKNPHYQGGMIANSSGGGGGSDSHRLAGAAERRGGHTDFDRLAILSG